MPVPKEQMTPMTNEQIVEAIQLCFKKLERNPNLRDLRLIGGVSEPVLYKRFGASLLLDWAAVARKLAKIPSVHEYGSAGRFSVSPFQCRYRRWAAVPQAFARFARESKLETGWQDVLQLSEAKAHKERKAAKAFIRPRVRKGPLHRDRPVYGRPMLLPEMAHEPVNELGVVFVFGMLVRRLGFVVQRIQPEFPDCEAMREVARGVWQRVRIEFEFESRNFLNHRHKKDQCDLIICWRHNWPDCPPELEVIELSKELGKALEQA